MNKESFINEANVLYDTVTGTHAKIRKNCENFIKAVLKEKGGRIDFEDYKQEDFVSVPYDGGNHPEYASNCFSLVNGVYVEDETIYLSTEDCDCYPLSDVDWDDVYNVATYINKLLNNS